MATITLRQNSTYNANHVHSMNAETPHGTVNLAGVGGGGASFTCSNQLASIQGATFVNITYDASVRAPIHERIQVSSVL